MTPDIDKLRELAENAIASIAKSYDCLPIEYREYTDDAIAALKKFEGVATPEAVIALLDRIEALEKEQAKVNTAGFHVMAHELQRILDSSLKDHNGNATDDYHVSTNAFMGMKIYTLKAWIESCRAASTLKGE